MSPHSALQLLSDLTQVLPLHGRQFPPSVQSEGCASSSLSPNHTQPLFLPCSVPWKVGPCGLCPGWLASGSWRLGGERKTGVFLPCCLPSLGLISSSSSAPPQLQLLWDDPCVVPPILNGPQQHNPLGSPVLLACGKLNTLAWSLFPAHFSVIFLSLIRLRWVVFSARTSR